MSNYSEPEPTDIFNQSDFQKRLFRFMGIAVLLASLTLVTLLISSSLRFRYPGEQVITQTVAVARLSLIQLHTQPVQHGFRLSFQALPGLAWYYLCWMLGAGSLAWLGRSVRKR